MITRVSVARRKNHHILRLAKIPGNPLLNTYYNSTYYYITFRLRCHFADLHVPFCTYIIKVIGEEVRKFAASACFAK